MEYKHYHIIPHVLSQFKKYHSTLFIIVTVYLEMCNTAWVFNILAANLIFLSPYQRISAELDLRYAENTQIVYPKVIEKPVRRRRDVHRNMYYEESGNAKIIEVAGLSIQLDSGSEGSFLVAPGLKTEWIGSDGGRSLRETKKCDYHSGVVRGTEKISTAAVTLCGHSVTAYFNVGGVPHFMQPLNDSGTAHVLYNRSVLHEFVDVEILVNANGNGTGYSGFPFIASS